MVTGIRDPDAVAGGAGYERVVTESDADVSVRSADSLVSALSDAQAGDVVYVQPDADIGPVPTNTLEVPRNVTLASTRDADHDGARIWCDSNPKYVDDFMVVHEGARVTGLEIEGPAKERSSGSSGHGVVVRPDAEVDNCEIWGWSYGGVDCGRGPNYVHHNHIHHCWKNGLGYGVTVGTGPGTVYVEFNQFDYCRHAIAGHDDAVAEIRDNLFTDTQTEHFTIDKHDPGGDYLVEYNEIREADRTNVQFQDGTPDRLVVRNNWTWNTNALTGGTGGEPFVAVEGEDFSTTTVENNHRGRDAPADAVSGGNSTDSDSGTEMDHTIVIDGQEAQPADYTFTVSSGEIRKNSRLGSVQESDTIEGDTVHGTVWSAEDAYDFNGDLLDFEFTGESSHPRVLLDGVEIDPASYPKESTDGDGSNGGSNPVSETITLTIAGSPFEIRVEEVEPGVYEANVTNDDSTLSEKLAKVEANASAVENHQKRLDDYGLTLEDHEARLNSLANQQDENTSRLGKLWNVFKGFFT